ncbi:hypothetical protein GCM10022261_20000 [Brevibacterium daeguense]|uniref:Coenzyme Q-binding protein COQ10 START domain-containing protein n=1 Tax=Brevibacterium daeguense TaxID=909936 RepID=A0ABP8EKG2_9MICO|nr:SRPBCC family protein [Brevibacterium daeguense]
MAEQDQGQNSSGKSAKSAFGEIVDQLPLDELKNQLGDFASAAGEKAISSFSDRIDGLIERLNSVATGDGGGGAVSAAATKGAEKLAQGDSPVKAGLSGLMSGATESVKQVFGGGGGGGGKKKKKFSNIVETIEVGVPVRVAYNQWTQFEDWTGFMKKLEHSEEQSDEKLSFKGQIFLSHRSWQSTVIQQVPDEQIVWKSTGEKGYLDGGVTFHEITPRLTRIVVVIEYHPQGFVEKTGNIWRAAGRRIRVELKLFVNHVMTSTILDPDGVEGWRGEIRDSEVVRTHEEALEAEQEEQAQQEDSEEEGQDQDQPQGELEQGEPGQDQPQDEAQDRSEAESEQDQDQSQDEDQDQQTEAQDQGETQDEPSQGETQGSPSEPESDAQASDEDAQGSASEGDTGPAEDQPSADSGNQADADDEQEEAPAETDQPVHDQPTESDADSSGDESSSGDEDSKQQPEADQTQQEEPPAQSENQ